MDYTIDIDTYIIYRCVYMYIIYTDICIIIIYTYMYISIVLYIYIHNYIHIYIVSVSYIYIYICYLHIICIDICVSTNIYIYTVHELLWVNDGFFSRILRFFPGNHGWHPPPWHAPQRAWLPPSLGLSEIPGFFAWKCLESLHFSMRFL